MPDSDQEPSSSSSSPSPDRGRRLTNRDVQKRRKRLRALLLKIGVLLLTLGAVVFVVGTLQRDRIDQYLDARATKRLFVEAEAAAERGDIEAARRLVAEVLEREPSHLEANRLAAVIEKEADPAKAAARLGTLEQAGGASSEERIDLLALHLSMGRFEEGVKLAEELMKVVPEDARLLTLMAKVRMLEGKQEEAEGMLAKARKLNPDLPEVRLLHAQSQLASPIGDVREVGWKTVREVAEENPEGLAGLEALRTIHAQRGSLYFPMEKYYRLFKNHPMRPVEVDPTVPLLAWELDLYPEEQLERGLAAIEAWAAGGLTGSGFDARLRWLSDRGGNEAVAKYLKEKPVGGEASLVPARLLALLNEGDREGAEKLVRELRGDPKLEALSFLCEAIMMIDGKEPDKEVEAVLVEGLNRARNYGESEVDTFLGFGRIAKARGFGELAREAFFGAMAGDSKKAHFELMLLAEGEEDFEAFLVHLEALLALDPANAELRAHTSYHQLVLGIHRDAARESARRLHALYPEDPEMQLVAAFAHHAFGEAEDALKLARGIDASALANERRVALVVIFRGAGEEEEAAAVAEMIDRSGLMAVERALLGE